MDIQVALSEKKRGRKEDVLQVRQDVALEQVRQTEGQLKHSPPCPNQPYPQETTQLP